MLQEGQDRILLQTLYYDTVVQVHYKCYGLNETVVTDKVSTTVDKLPQTWHELFAQQPVILDSYQKIAKWNAEAPRGHTKYYYLKFLDVETHIKSPDNTTMVYRNSCQP